MKIVNRRAKHEYQILDEYEAGIVLSGAEVKSLREGRGSLVESFARIRDNEAWLYNFNIPKYKHTDKRGYDPQRTRKLLLKKHEIVSLEHRMAGTKLTLVPLACYTTGRFLKVKLGLGKGRKQYEKREVKKKRDIEKQVARILKNRR